MRYLTLILLALAVTFIAAQQVISMDKQKGDDMNTSMEAQPMNTKFAVFAGGCFWCTESDFEHVDGVIDAISGYTGGHVANPTYKEVSHGGTGHVESVKVIYDPSKITYTQLLDVFWHHINPTDAGGQFVDRGNQYRSVIFYADEQERQLAEASKKKLAQSGWFKESIVTDILPLGEFYKAEDYHQNYYKRNPIRYRYYRSGSGRDQFLEKTWRHIEELMKNDKTNTNAMKDGMNDSKAENMSTPMDNKKDDTPMSINMDKTNDTMMKDGTTAPMAPADESMMYSKPSDSELRQRLTPLQYKVTRKEGTEPPFDNAYWDNHAEGIYVDIVSGEPLFSSTDKYNSGTGWPSFTKPLEPDNIVEKTDRSLFTVRTEVRSKHGDSHLGHVFNDGPQPTGLRYCINSAALRFIPKAELEANGLGRYLALFK